MTMSATHAHCGGRHCFHVPRIEPVPLALPYGPYSPYIRIYIYIYACVSSFVDCQVNCHIAFSTRSTRLILILTFREFNTKEPNILPFSNNRNSFCLERYPSLVYNFKIYTSWYTPCECTLTVPPTKRERWQISRARSGPPRPNDDLRSV